MMANYLGQMGIDVLVVEKLDKLIDHRVQLVLMTRRCAPCGRLAWSIMFCRTLRRGTMRFSPKRSLFADIQPMTDEFGWPRRNAFIQPQVDAVMLEGLSRFPE